MKEVPTSRFLHAALLSHRGQSTVLWGLSKSSHVSGP